MCSSLFVFQTSLLVFSGIIVLFSDLIACRSSCIFRLHCSFTVATRLFSYILQGLLLVLYKVIVHRGLNWVFSVAAELGDFDPKRHTLGYASEFRFLPNQVSAIFH